MEPSLWVCSLGGVRKPPRARGYYSVCVGGVYNNDGLCVHLSQYETGQSVPRCLNSPWLKLAIDSNSWWQAYQLVLLKGSGHSHPPPPQSLQVHGHGPQDQVCCGSLIIQSPFAISLMWLCKLQSFTISAFDYVLLGVCLCQSHLATLESQHTKAYPPCPTNAVSNKHFRSDRIF